MNSLIYDSVAMESITCVSLALSGAGSGNKFVGLEPRAGRSNRAKTLQHHAFLLSCFNVLQQSVSNNLLRGI